jgi:ATP-dependent Lon protease
MTTENNRLLPLLPLRDIVVFPSNVRNLYVGRSRSINAVEEAMRGNHELLLAAQKKANTHNPSPNDIFTVGTVAEIMQTIRRPDGTVKLLIEGRRRAKIARFVPNEAYFLCETEVLEEVLEEDAELEALQRSVREIFESYSRLSKRLTPDVFASIKNMDSLSRLADSIAAHLPIKHADKQSILEMPKPRKRLEKLYELMQTEIEILQVERKIRSRVKKQMERTEKEYYLNEQMRAIQKELGERDEHKNEISELEELLAEKSMPEEARTRTAKEIKKLKMMSPMSAEATVVRNYIDWCLNLPWQDCKSENLDLKLAEDILEQDHYGLKKPKERILEYLAVQHLVERMRGPILCLVGPPGVGKTSLARSIARATGRDFIRQSLGGVRDEAEIRGHRRTYIGALPGKIIQSLKRAGSSNPVFLLDEVDKMSTDFRGDPSAALLEVLDPEQNSTFMDHYLDLDYDLSRVMFVCTANNLQGIPGPLEDRLEVIRIAGYTDIEKMNIAGRYLIPKQLKENGLGDLQVDWSERSTRTVMDLYTREAGVRTFERQVGGVCRKIARDLVKEYSSVANRQNESAQETQNEEGSTQPKQTDATQRMRLPEGLSYKVTPAKVKKFLGVPTYRRNKREEKSEVGLATGLAWTQMGGEILQIEVSTMPGKGKLTVTGKLGDVMQESSQAAMSYVRARAASWGLNEEFYQSLDIHIHVPEGAIPKDGPSAGITMATALVSALTKIPVRKEVAMTGEITLRGRVLPIGGLKEKSLAAHRAGITEIVIPKDNEKDIEEIPKSVARHIKIHLVDHLDAVLRHGLELDDVDEFFARVRRESVLEMSSAIDSDTPEGSSPDPH